MKIVIFSSVFNHHSLPLCDELNALPDVECIFVETMEEEAERKALGYHPYDRDYVLNMYSSDANSMKAYEIALTADVMIASVFPYKFLKERLDRNRLTFLCQERMFKGGATFKRRARAWLFNMKKFFRFRNKSLYFLSIGKKAAQDYKSIGFYKNKCFQWAYFPPFIPYDISQLMEEKQNKTIEILFVGRLISLKHPEYPLFAVKTLLGRGYDIHLTYVGCGELEKCLQQEAEGITENVSFMGSKSPERVREYMERANIVTFTSNSLEGWGVVVNEAMNSGCAVVCSDAVGAAATLLRDGENGCVYEDENYDEFLQKLEELVKDRERIEKLGKAAYQTISQQYNATVAAQRLRDTCQVILNGNADAQYVNGIMEKLC